MDDAELLEVLNEAADAVTRTLASLDDWGLAGTRAGQYHSDLAADAAAVAVLRGAGLAVLSEESGVSGEESPGVGGRDGLTVVLDPVDGSTNAARGIPWYATSLCAVDDQGARAAVVLNQASGVRFQAVRGGGATRDGQALATSGTTRLGEAIIAFSGYPARYLGWSQYRGLGAAALDLCAVADGTLDGYAVVGGSALGAWDYLGGMLVCTEAGGTVGDVEDRDLVVLSHAERRAPVAGATGALHHALVEAVRDSVDGPGA